MTAMQREGEDPNATLDAQHRGSIFYRHTSWGADE